LQRPTCLKIVATRPPPPLGVGGGLTFGAVSVAGRAHPEDLALKVESAVYSAGILIMSDSSATAMSSLLVVQKDSAAQLSHPSTFGAASNSFELYEKQSLLCRLRVECFVPQVSSYFQMLLTPRNIYHCG
jgi:hypothetical protein